MSHLNRANVKTRNTAVSNGIDKHVPASISIGSVTYTPPELKGVFIAHNTALDAADALHKQWTDQVQVAKAAGIKADGTYRLLRSSLIGQYGNDANAILNDFGMATPKSTGAKTVQVKAEAVLKRAATRAARHTMGKVQRKAVTGTVVAAPATAPVATPAAPATPVASTPVAAPGTPASPTSASH